MVEIVILLCLILVNGLFVMAEIALVSARRSKLEDMASKGDVKARSALELTENPELFLSTAQIGITLIAILTGYYSGEKFTQDLTPYVLRAHVPARYAASVSTVIIVILVTFLSILFGELIPKRFGLLQAERIARAAARPMRLFSKIGHPFVWILNGLSNLFFSIFNIKSTRDSNVTEDEIKAIIHEGTEQGTIDEAEQEIIERVFHLGDRNITSLMTHRSDIIWFDLDATEDLIKEKILGEPHSVYPVCDGEIDNIKGMVSIKDLYVTDDSTRFREIMTPALFIPENNTPYQVLEKFKQSKTHSCCIVDEYGSMLGLITLNDILEAIVGDIPQPDMADYEIVRRDDGSFLIDGQIPFYDFLTHFDKTEWMNEGEHEFDTLAGFILHQLEHIPKTGEQFDWKEFRFEIMDMDAQRIDKVMVTFQEPAEDLPEPEN